MTSPRGARAYFYMHTETIIETEEEQQNKLLKLAYKVANGEANASYLYCLQENKFYVFEKGVWIQIFDIEFMGRISKEIKRMNKLTMQSRKQILENFKMIKYQHLTRFNTIEMLNLENGMLNPYKGELLDHDEIFYSTIRLPYQYDENATCDLWLKTLGEILEGDNQKINILQEFFGYCLTKETKYHKALLLLGESRSGKSTILQTLRAVIGTKNCSSVPLKYISNPQYTPMLISKLVNIDTDVSAKASDFEAEFKTITSGEPVSCNQKYAPAFDFIPYCKVVMAANIFPRITDHSSAFYKRLILIPCNRVFEDNEQNRDLPHQLIQECPGILNWSIEGLKRLTKRGRFEQLDFMQDAIQELENDNNPVNLFFEEFIEISFGSEITKQELYERYKSWSDKTKNFVLSQARFASCVHKKYHKETPKDARSSEGIRPRVWRNIKYVEFKHSEQPNQGWQE